MIIRFEKLPDTPNYRVVDPTWRGDSAELVIHIELTKAIDKLWGEPVNDGDVIKFEISAVPLVDGEMFKIEGIKKGLPGAMYTNKTVGLQYICELLLLYVGPEYPEHFYIKKYEKNNS